MKSAELKEKRVRHCYPKREIYHRFAHEGKLMWYTSTFKHSCSCVDNIFFILDYAKYYEKDKEWYSDLYVDKAVAVIDRKHKKILISKKYDSHCWSIVNSLSNDYEIFYTNKNIPCYDILKRNKRNELLKLHAEYLVNKFCLNILPFYATLQDYKKTCFYNISYFFTKDNPYCSEIVDFVNKYNLTYKKWYKEPIFPKFKETYWKDWSRKNIIEFDVPSLKQIVEQDIFSHEEIIKLQQAKFYTDYCYGHGIPFKDVIKNWNKTDWDRKLIAKYNRSNIDWNPEEYPTFNDFVSHTTKIINKFRHQQIIKWQEEADANRANAIKQLMSYNDSIGSVTDWRENKGYANSSYRVNFLDYIPPKTKHDMGRWTEHYVSNCGGNKFTNTQLRLNNNIIETSRYAKVPLDDAIKCWKLFIKLKEQFEVTGKDCDAVYRLESKNIKIGIYNLRFIKYCNKITDDNISLNRKEWVIVIGCHHLWLDDIFDFIRYYKLEDKFNIKNYERNL